MTHVPPSHTGRDNGSLDGDGAGDHDQPYRFGDHPRASVPYPFNTRQYARLLVLRGRVRDTFREAVTLDAEAAADNVQPAA